MARQTGPVKLSGTLGNLSFYCLQGTWVVRMKGGFEGQRIKKEARYARTRENAQEFGQAATAGKLLRDALAPLAQGACDKQVTPRLTQLMHRITRLDTVSQRGKRCAAEGLKHEEGRSLLQGFECNQAFPLMPLFSIGTGDLYRCARITLLPQRDASRPPGITHIRLRAATLHIDLSQRTHTLVCSAEQLLPLSGPQRTVLLPVNRVQAERGTVLLVLRADLLHEQGGQLQAWPGAQGLCILCAGEAGEEQAAQAPVHEPVQQGTRCGRAGTVEPYGVQTNRYTPRSPVCPGHTRRAAARTVMRS